MKIDVEMQITQEDLSMKAQAKIKQLEDAGCKVRVVYVGLEEEMSASEGVDSNWTGDAAAEQF